MRYAELAGVLRIWAALSEPAPVSWIPLASMIQVADAEARELESQLSDLVNQSDAGLRAFSLCDPLLADAGLNRWLKREREEAYSDWLKWILDELGSAAGVLKILGIEESEIVASCRIGVFKIEREVPIPDRRLDLLLTLGDSVMIIVEVKKYSAETADTAKQAPYYEWLEKQKFRQRKGVLLVAEAAEENYENFSRLLWADVCIRLRRLLPGLSTRVGVVKTAMFVAFVGAVETNLLNFAVPPQAEAVERFYYGRTIEHLKKCLRESTV